MWRFPTVGGGQERAVSDPVTVRIPRCSQMNERIRSGIERPGQRPGFSSKAAWQSPRPRQRGLVCVAQLSESRRVNTVDLQSVIQRRNAGFQTFPVHIAAVGHLDGFLDVILGVMSTMFGRLTSWLSSWINRSPTSMTRRL